MQRKVHSPTHIWRRHETLTNTYQILTKPWGKGFHYNMTLSLNGDPTVARS